MRSTTVASSTLGSISRAASTPGLAVQPELLLADREDRVGVEAVERPERDELVVALAAERPLVVAVGERFLEPRGIAPERSPRGVRGRGQAASLGVREVRARGDDLVEERGQVAGRLDLEPLPQPDLGDRRPRLRAIEEVGDRLEPAGEQREPLRKRREVLGEDQEQGVADRVERGRALLPGPDGLGVEDRPPQVVDLEVALEPAQRREARRFDRLDRREVGLLVGQLAEQRVARCRRRGGRPRCGCRRRSPAPGCRGRAAGSASRRGRRGARPADPGGSCSGG